MVVLLLTRKDMIMMHKTYTQSTRTNTQIEKYMKLNLQFSLFLYKVGSSATKVSDMISTI